MVCVHTSSMSNTAANLTAAYLTTALRSNAPPVNGARSCEANALNAAVGPAMYSGGYVTYARYSPSEYLTLSLGLDTRLQ
jgi:hypothetical protein